MKSADFHLDDDLTQLLPRARRANAIVYQFSGPQSLKHLLESLGIPHTEVGAVQVNGKTEALQYLVNDGDQVEVSSSALAEDLADEPRFVLDGHLGRLVSRLRMLGLDCLYWIDAEDGALLHAAISSNRILLTRDRRLLMRKILALGYLVRHLEPRRQLQEVLDRYRLRKWIRPFQRCIRCNHVLEPADKDSVLERLEPLTRRYFSEFRVCPGCGHIYWKGSHYDRMLALIADLR